MRSANFGAAFGWDQLAGISGLLHDIGKLSSEFQAYIRGNANKGGDHSSAGALIARQTYPGFPGACLSAIIAAHHAGLADGPDLDERLKAQAGRIPAKWQEQIGPLPLIAPLQPPKGEIGGFSEAFLIRMLFSCLVDADRLATEEFYAKAENTPKERGSHLSIETLRERLRAHMATMRNEETPLNSLRARVLDHAVAKAALEPGLFTMTVPTGGGKTLASLSFALEHAATHGLRRVIYVIPFTSIIEQTAGVFRKALATEHDVLEHHASFDWEAMTRKADDEGRGDDPAARLRRAAENWDVPVVVTTSVQFYESLFAAQTSRCRKLHNIAGSVVVLDEVQTLPPRLLLPALAALDELKRHYRTSIVLCTATQPALRKIDEALVQKNPVKNLGLDIEKDRELAPDPRRLYAALKRVEVTRLGETDDATIAARFEAQPQMLCIVNTRKHAAALFDAMKDMPGAVHLTTTMCPRHRRIVLAELRQRLLDKKPVRLVATSLIEAGVDIDFSEVWRAEAGLDSIAQAAGRCNREGFLNASGRLGRLVVFMPVEHKSTGDQKQFWQAAQSPLRRFKHDPLGLDAIDAYFKELYFDNGLAELDAAKIKRDGKLVKYPVLNAIHKCRKDFQFPFETIAEAFRLIDEAMMPVIVPWKVNAEDKDFEKLIASINSTDKPRSCDLRRLQQYTVSIPPKLRDEWLAKGVLYAVHPKLGEGLLRLRDMKGHYDAATGLKISEPMCRSAESNML